MVEINSIRTVRFCLHLHVHKLTTLNLKAKNVCLKWYIKNTSKKR